MLLVGKKASPPEDYYFYGGEIHLRYYNDSHAYYLVRDGEEVRQDGVTETVHILDKPALLPWACKMMSLKLLSNMNDYKLQDGFIHIDSADFESLVLAAKSAHKEHLEDAADVGKQAHGWLEEYIKAGITDTKNQEIMLNSLGIKWQEL